MSSGSMSTATKNSMRGLTNFITELRKCPSKEKETKRVDLELAKIRKHFRDANNLDGYDRRKYVTKLLYIYMIGYDVDFGHMEAVALLSSGKFQEKLTGYMATTLLINESHEMFPLIVQSLQNDLQSRQEFYQALALTALANIGGRETSEAVGPIVQKLLVAKSTKPAIKKKAAIALLRMYRKSETLPLDPWADKIISLFDDGDLAVLNPVASLLLHVVPKNPKVFASLRQKIVSTLSQLILEKAGYDASYIYYTVPHPWLTVKLLRLLHNFPEDTNDKKLPVILKTILDSNHLSGDRESISPTGSPNMSEGRDMRSDRTPVNQRNTTNAVLFEAIDLIIEYDSNRDLLKQAMEYVSKSLAGKAESNIRYLGLGSLLHIAQLDSETSQIVKRNQQNIIDSLRDVDITIRKRSLNLLYTMCDATNAKQIISELLQYLSDKNTDFQLQEELVLKIAIMSEKFTKNYSWYVDVILRLVYLAGDYVSSQIWFRVIQVITNHEDIQEYAAKVCFLALQKKDIHDTMVKIGGYVLGEFGHLIAEHPQSKPKKQFTLLYTRFPHATLDTKAILLTSFAKFMNLYTEVQQPIRTLFANYARNVDVELQQRAYEYLKMMNVSEALMQKVLDAMPHWNSKKEEKMAPTESLIDVDSQRTTSSSRPQSTNQSQLAAQQSQQNNKKQMSLLDELLLGPEPTTATTSMSNGNGLLSTMGYGNSSQQATSTNPFATTSAPINQISTPVPPVTTSPSTSFADFSNNSAVGKTANRVSFVPTTQGVLYKDATTGIQVGFKSEFNGRDGRLMLFFGNSSGASLSGLNTKLSKVEGLEVNAQPLSADSIPAGGQTGQLFTFSATGAFSEFPRLKVDYVSNGTPKSFVLGLPIIATAFNEPQKLNGPDFFVEWKKLPEANQIQTVVKTTGEPNLDQLGKQLNALKFMNLVGIDPNKNNLVAAAKFNAGTPTSVLVRVETNAQAQMLRISIRSSNPELAAAFKIILSEELTK